MDVVPDKKQMHWPRMNANSFARGCIFFSLLELSKNGNRRRGGRGPHFPGTARFVSMNLRGRVAQLVRAPALQAGSPRFRSVTAHHAFCFPLLAPKISFLKISF